MIHFLLLVNKQGQTRLAQYANYMDLRERVTLEGEVVRKCLQRKETECSFIEHLQYKLIYRRYASLFFIVELEMDNCSSSFTGVDGDENELAILEFIHVVVETLDKYFENVCELDVMFNLEKAHFIVEEMFCSGSIVETNKVNSLKSLVLMDRAVKK
eukprot:gene16182-24798_t